MNPTKIAADVVFRVFTSCAGDPATLILDVRPVKEFKKKHIANAYCVRLAANGQALLDYSKNTYNLGWSKDCWWDKHVVVYGEPKLKRDHPVVAFLSNDKHAKSINVYPDGLEEFEKQYPFLVTASIKANSGRRYPGEIIPSLLYLGDWDHAQDTESLDHLKIRRVITVHNNPENLKLPSRFKQLRFVLADVETEDVSRFFNDSYTFIEEAKTAREAVLVHCGAGVSRSAALCIAYLMRKFNWPAAKARAHCVQRRSIVMPNDGFWRSLCAFENELGIQQRSDPTAVSGFSGANAPAKLAEGAAGDKVEATFVPIQKIRAAEAAAAARAAQIKGQPESTGKASRVDGQTSEQNENDKQHRKDEDIQHDRERERYQDKERDEVRSKHRDRSRERRRSRGRDRKRDKSREAQSDLDSSKRRKGASTAPEEAKAAPEEPAPVILETSKEGKVLGRLEISLKTPHQRCVFGRLPSNEVVLEHLSISRQHAQLSLDAAGDLFLTDLGSAHRTNVDGVWIRPNQPRALPRGAVFRLGGSTREFRVVMFPRERAKEEARLRRAQELAEAKAAEGTALQ